MKKVLMALVVTPLFLTGCLKTRNEVRETEQRQVMQQQVTTLQRSNADVASRFADIEEQMRSLNGRVDVVENRVGQNNSGIENAMKNTQQQNQDLNQKVILLQEALTKMEKDIFTLNAEIQSLKADRLAGQAEKVAKQSRKNVYEVGEEFFNKKDWKQAILNYQKYRDDNPKGSKFAEATYKIGVSFQELGMKEEAKTFYDEVVSKFPKSDEARRSKTRLKGLKK
ncbi:MAG: hypothetical protein OM95_01440 [Bdellovibrio sp. ArHS]|uniref:tetratricopeptide repeat protein n=1 Tax=Bdellovibrio sp. ArHS TaxID=1569284 RepID=UPI000583B513|nr:tetratricopeptide repeat protein [Bdellovibrio sp. ArHS]KHD89764.1 MAG: hypothetical protein OM95_01440 [Bdellovibrio sp. ArHS]